MKNMILSVCIVASLAAASVAANVVRTVSVTGVGRVAALPNVATVTLSFVDTSDLNKPRAELIAANTQRAEPALAHIKELVGNQGSVRSSLNVQRTVEWDQEARKNVATGQVVTRTIEVTLRGEGAIEGKLAKLYDNEKIKADEVSDPVYGLATRRDAATQRSALKLAYANAVDRAQAQLEPGEKLGKAIARGTETQTYQPRGGAKAMRAMAMAESADAGGGAPSIESGKLERSAATNVVFEVKGKPKRISKRK